MGGVSLNQQIEEVQRELKEREKVYPRLYLKGTMRRSHGEYHILRMRAVLDTLYKLKEVDSQKN